MNTSQIGATAGYGFAHFGINGGYEDYLWCIRRLGELGFRNFNLEILENEHEALFTPDRVKAFRDLADSLGMRIPIFTAYYLENDLASIDAARRWGVEKFRLCTGVTQALGAATINIASEFPPEFVEAYRPEYVHSPAGQFGIPPGVSWDEIWDDYAAAMRQCADLAAERGLEFSLEPRANCIVSTVDSFLRLADHVQRRNFTCSLDLMHCAYQREEIPTAIRKAGRLLSELQVCDADGQTLTHYAVGAGKIDFAAILKALDEIGFGGALSLEIYGVDNIDEAYRSSRITLEKIMCGEQASARV